MAKSRKRLKPDNSTPGFGTRAESGFPLRIPLNLSFSYSG
nr:MAG TPA_asm: hypothetical protein [Caudoviricetes sp.]